MVVQGRRQEIAPMGKQPVRILLIDDDEDDYVMIRKLISEGFLKDCNFRWIASYDDGLEAIGSNEYDVCLLDYRLGRQDGLDLLRELSGSARRVPIIFLTGHGSYSVDLEAMKAGAADYLVKGQFDADLLERSIRYALERNRVQEDLRDHAEKLRETNYELSRALGDLRITEEKLLRQNKKLKMTQEQLLYRNEELLIARESAEVERQRYLDLFNYAPEGYMVTDEDGRILEANRAAKALLRMKMDALAGAPFESFVDEEDLEEYREQVQRLKRLRSIRNWEVRLKVDDRPSFYVEINTMIILPRSGEHFTFRWSIQDISRRKRAEGLLKDSEGELRFLSTRLLTAQEEERKKIAGELHDSVGSLLGAVQFSLRNAIGRAEEGETNIEMLQNIASLIERTIEESRRIMTDLRPSILDDLGIVATIKWFCVQQRGVYPSISFDESVTLEEEDVPEELNVVLFRIIQEAFHNIVKYSKAERVLVSLGKNSEHIELTIRDNGTGFDKNLVLSRDNPRKGLGLTSMRERAELSGGTFSLDSAVGEGTTIRVVWPGKGEEPAGGPRFEENASA